MVSLRNIISHYGGSLAPSGRQAYMRAPGHSTNDRSVSLLLNSQGRLIINCFGPDDWRDIRAILVRDGFIEAFDPQRQIKRKRPPAPVNTNPVPNADRKLSFCFALEAWLARKPIPGTRAEAYLRKRGISHLIHNSELGFHPSLSVSYNETASRRTAPCLLARLSDPVGQFAGVQATFLFSNNFDRKLRLCFGMQKDMRIALTPEVNGMIIGEGLETSAAAGLLFERPALPLLNSGNISRFIPSPHTSNLWLAADNDRAGQKAAEALEKNCLRNKTILTVKFPQNEGWDWNRVLVSMNKSSQPKTNFTA